MKISMHPHLFHPGVPTPPPAGNIARLRRGRSASMAAQPTSEADSTQTDPCECALTSRVLPGGAEVGTSDGGPEIS